MNPQSTVAGVVLLGLAWVCMAESEPPMELTDGAKWQFRVRGPERTGAWQGSLAKAMEDAPAPVAARWPRVWRTFVAWEPDEKTRATTAPSQLTEVPTSLELGGVSACRATLPLYTGGVLDLTVGHGAPGEHRWAWVFGSLQAPDDEQVELHVDPAGPLTVWLDGKELLRTDKPGPLRKTLSLSKGDHVLAARVTSSGGEWHFTGRLTPPGPRVGVQARCVFQAQNPKQFASLTLAASRPDRAELNGQALPDTLGELIWDRRPGIPSELLKAGDNALTVTWGLHRARAMLADEKSPELALHGIRPADARIVLGPVVTLDNTGLGIRLVTDATVPASLRIDGRRIVSEAGLFHHWMLADLEPGTEYAYTVQAGEGPSLRGTLRTPPAKGQPVTMALVGDPQSGKAWRDVAAALVKARPDVLVILGDVVVDGLVVEQWREDFLAPGAEVLASVPTRVVPGNHDRYSPLLEKLLGDGVPGVRWTLRAGGAVLVGIDGGEDFRPDAPASRWLDKTLRQAGTNPVFVLSHYPAYSSRNHGKLADDGRVLEWTSRVARNRIVPMLSRHGARALFGGHDHGYERSELPGGLTAIVTGGGGAGTYPKRDDAAKQNPHSKAFAAKHHLSLLRIGPDGATLRVLTPDGKQIDTRTWSARPSKETSRD